MFEIIMLPAEEGDCLLIRYGEVGAIHRVLIDVGRKKTFKVLKKVLPEGERHLELFVISHIDRDHIEGAIALLGDKAAGFTFDDIWFNGYRHLDQVADDFGAVQGEALTAFLTDETRNLPWNRAFDGEAVRLSAARPVVKALPGGLRLTLLSPGAEQLKALKPRWEEEVRLAEEKRRLRREATNGGAPDQYDVLGGDLEGTAALATGEDHAAPNGSSIAFLAEFDGKRVLFAADAHPTVLCDSLDTLPGPQPIACDLIKVAHHGSQANTTRTLLSKLRSDRFLISTSGAYFGHPDAPAIARILTTESEGQKTLYFNYRQPKTTVWSESVSDQRKYNYRCEYPAEDGKSVTIAL